MTLCQYKHVLGIPMKGFHKQRIYGFALFDIIGTIIAAAIISRYASLNFTKVLLILFAIGTFLHILFCVDTTFVKLFTS